MGRTRLVRHATIAAASLGLVWTFGFAVAAGATPHGPMVKDGYVCTVVGTSGNDNLVGHAGDVVCGLGGNDTLTAVGGGTVVLIGGGGADVLNGSTDPTSTDVLIGDSGSDTEYANAGDDTLNGSGGNDTLVAGTGTDTLNGGAGNDILDGGSGTDTLNGGPGSDDITGGSGDDTLDGGPGPDTLVAGSGTDFLNGGPGPDTLDGGAGNDTLDGGPGVDTITAGSGDDVIDGGPGGDSVDCGTGGNPVTVVGSQSNDDENSDCQGDNVDNVSQEWQGTVTAFDPGNPGTVSVSVSEENDGAQMWLAGQNPLCDTSNLTFDLATAPANIQVDNGGTIALGDDIEIASQAGTVNCVPVAIDVQAQTQDG